MQEQRFSMKFRKQFISDIWAVRSAGIDPVTGREIFIKKDGTQTFEFDYNDEVIVGNSDPKLEGVIGSSLIQTPVAL